MAQKSGEKVQELRKKLKEKGEEIPENFWSYVNSMEHNLSYLLPDDFMDMDAFLADVDKLLQKNDIARLGKLLEELSSALKHSGQRYGMAILLNSPY